MFKSYFKSTCRSLLKNKFTSIINISGLAIGMASAVLIFLWIQNEVSYDRFHANTHRIYQSWTNDKVGGELRSSVVTPEIMAPILKNDVPEIEQVSRIDWGNNYLFTVDEKSLQSRGNVVDPEFLSMFSFPMVKRVGLVGVCAVAK